MTGGIAVVQASPEHVPQLEDLWRGVVGDTRPDEPGAQEALVEGLNHSLRSFNFLNSDSFWLYIAIVDGETVGYLTAVRIPKPDQRIGVIYIDELRVLTAYRRRGAGSALVQKVCDIGYDLGFWRVRLNADRDDPGVCAFYSENGFKHSGDGFFEKKIPARER